MSTRPSANQRGGGDQFHERSVFLALVLRHDPGRIGLTLDGGGWADVAEVSNRMTINGHPLSIAEIEAIVSTDPKRRYSLSDGRIRACQGHSIAIDLGLAAAMPPEVLFHGTAKQSIESIRREGLRPIQRRYVHLSINEETAAAVGTRHGAPIVLTVNAAAMLSDGHVFLVSENGVWLVEHVPPQYLRGNSFVPD